MNVRTRYFKDFKTHELIFHYTDAQIAAAKFTPDEEAILADTPITPIQAAEQIAIIAKGIARGNS